MTIEADIEDYFCRELVKAGGEVRKVQWTGRRHAPDRRAMHIRLCAWVEFKRPGAKPRPGQEREITRMRTMGETVFVVSTYEEADAVLGMIR